MRKYVLSDNQKSVIKKIYSTIKKTKPNSNAVAYMENKMASVEKSIKIGPDTYNVQEQKIFIIKEYLEVQKSVLEEAVNTLKNINKASLMKTFNSIPTIKKLKTEVKEVLQQKSDKKSERIIELEYKVLEEENKIRDNILDGLLDDYYKYLDQKTNTEKKKETIAMVNSLFNNAIKIFNYFYEKEMSYRSYTKSIMEVFLKDKNKKSEFINFLTNNAISVYNTRSNKNIKEELHKATITMRDSEYLSLETEERFSRHSKFSSRDAKKLQERWSNYYKNKEKHIRNSKWYKNLKESYNELKSFENNINAKYNGTVLKEIKTTMYYQQIDYYDETICEYLMVKRDKYGKEEYEYENVSTPKGAIGIAHIKYNVNPLLLNAKLKSEFNKVRNSRVGIKKIETEIKSLNTEIKSLNKEIQKDKSIYMGI